MVLFFPFGSLRWQSAKRLFVYQFVFTPLPPAPLLQVINPITRTPVAYKLVPAAHPPLAAQPGSLISHKGHFATKQLWVTPHSDKQAGRASGGAGGRARGGGG